MRAVATPVTLLLLAVTGGVGVATVAGCSKRAATSAAPTVTVAAMHPAPLPSGETVAPKDHGSRKMRGLDVPVFVDGVQRGVLRAGDLPALPVAKAWTGAEGFRLTDYLATLGVSAAKVKTVHLMANGNRIGGVDGSELLADKERFVVRFSDGDTGSPITTWSFTGLKNELAVHEVRRVYVYVDKAVPALDSSRHCYLDEARACSDKVPHADIEIAKGTRVYVDGKMVGFVKRRQLGDALVLGDTADGQHRFSVARFVGSLGVDLKGIQGVELVAGDDVIARADSATWAKHQGALSFTTPPHSHGKVKVAVPADMQAVDAGTAVDGRADREALITSVVVYKTTSPSKRELAFISEETDRNVQLAAATAKQAE